MLTYLVSTVLPIAWKTVLISGAIFLIAFIAMIVFGGLTVVSESVFGAIAGVICTIIPLLVVRISAFVFSLSFTITAILFVIKLII